VAFLVSGAEILTDEGAMTIWEIAVVDLFGVIWASCQHFNVASVRLELTVQLMAV